MCQISPLPENPYSLLIPSLPGDLSCCHPAACSPGCPHVPTCYCADAILDQSHPLPILSQSPLPQAHLPQTSSIWAAVHSTSLSLAPTETQDQLGNIRGEIRSLQEQLPLLGVEENVGAFVDNVTLVLEEHRETITTLDGLR